MVLKTEQTSRAIEAIYTQSVTITKTRNNQSTVSTEGDVIRRTENAIYIIGGQHWLNLHSTVHVQVCYKHSDIFTNWKHWVIFPTTLKNYGTFVKSMGPLFC